MDEPFQTKPLPFSSMVLHVYGSTLKAVQLRSMPSRYCIVRHCFHLQLWSTPSGMFFLASPCEKKWTPPFKKSVLCIVNHSINNMETNSSPLNVRSKIPMATQRLHQMVSDLFILPLNPGPHDRDEHRWTTHFVVSSFYPLSQLSRVRYLSVVGSWGRYSPFLSKEMEVIMTVGSGKVRKLAVFNAPHLCAWNKAWTSQPTEVQSTAD